MKCPECGRENPDDAVTCAECGWVLVWPPPDPPPVRTSSLAIASAVLGALSIPCTIAGSDPVSICLFSFACGVTSVSAVILGIVALAYIELRRPALKGRICAITGIILSLLTFILINTLRAPR